MSTQSQYAKDPQAYLKADFETVARKAFEQWLKTPEGIEARQLSTSEDAVFAAFLAGWKAFLVPLVRSAT